MKATPVMSSTQVEHIRQAEQLAKEAQTLDDLRRAQSVLLTLGHGLNLEEAARAIGRSTSWVCGARQAFIAGQQKTRNPKHGGRRNQILPKEEEAAFMEEAWKNYRRLIAENGNGEVISFHGVVRDMLDERAGRMVSDTTAFALMARVGRTKFKNYAPYMWKHYRIRYF